MNIRAIAPADLPEILEINQSMVPAVGSVDSERMAFLVATCEQALLVEAQAGSGEPVVQGFSLVFAPNSPYDSVNYLWFAEHFPEAYYLDRVAFRESAQGQGLGKALYKYIEAELRDKGAAELGLEVNIEPPNHQSLGFHKGQGYVEVGQQQTPYKTTVSLQRKAL